MNYIFLDIDGVMNNRIDWMQKVDNKSEQFRSHRMFCDEAWQLLSDVVKKTKAKIVLSSSWRIAFVQDGDVIRSLRPSESSSNKLLEYFNNYNIPLVGLTTKVYDLRGIQIQEYVQENFTEDDKWIVIDDEEFDIKNLVPEEQFIKTEFETGLQQHHCEQIINYFNE